MKILVAPLNWGLGHASRCVPLIQQWLNEGHEVVLAGDGDSLTLLRKHFPKLRYAYLAPLRLRYSNGNSQVWAMAKSLPQLLKWGIQDHVMLGALLKEERFDRVVSDNRFGLFVKGEGANGRKANVNGEGANVHIETIYITHQLQIRLPKGWRWAEGLLRRWHKRIWRHYDEVWVPDYADEAKSLSRWLGHLGERQGAEEKKIRYIGPLSRFAADRDVRNGNEMVTGMPRESAEAYAVVAVLSGLEPQRSILEREIVQRYQGSGQRVLVVQGLPGKPMTRVKRGNITIVPYMGDEELQQALLGAQKIIARSGYSTIMDLHALGVLGKAELIPTPGQSEQEYLAEVMAKGEK
ncbi:MAG: hypothetical protein IJ814_05280 [Paludibacteraceae bacterium]|nr:hypothetical protein [Paludibacteraceae bacterium]